MSLMQSSGTITLRQIHDTWATSGATGYYDLNSYRGQGYTRNGSSLYGSYPTSSISIQTFYGTGPYIAPAPPGDSGPPYVSK